MPYRQIKTYNKTCDTKESFFVSYAINSCNCSQKNINWKNDNIKLKKKECKSEPFWGRTC